MNEPETMLDFIDSCLILADTPIAAVQLLRFDYNEGYAKYRIELIDAGTLEGISVWHPNGVCEGNPCAHCGTTTWEDKT